MKTIFSKEISKKTDRSVGLDPGIKAALTSSDGEIYQPENLSSQRNKERRLKRLFRQLARQTKTCNPQCFNEKGEWKRGQKLTFRSKGMLETAAEIAEIKRYFKDSKSDYYHKTAVYLLNNYDLIAIGNAKMHKLVRGRGKAKRAMNTRVREHAISDFIGKIKDKANLSLTPKQILVVSERNTTVTCHVCKNKTKLELSDRIWKCNHCGTDHNRDINAAVNIRNLALETLVKDLKTARD